MRSQGPRSGRGETRRDPEGRSSEASGPSPFEHLRRQEANAESNHLVIATIRIRIPASVWMGAFSERHPNLRLEVLNRSEVDPDRSVSDIWVGPTVGTNWTREIQGHRGVHQVDRLVEAGGGALYRVTYDDPPVVKVYRELGIPIQFPLRIRGGQILWEAAARESDFRCIMDHIRDADPRAVILSIRRRPLRTHLPELTDSQHALLTSAMAEGYFAVPRSITLTALAKKLGRSKSSVSEGLALIEKKILESALRPSPRVG